MLMLVVKLKIKAEHIAEFETELRRHVGWTRKNEKGCVRFDVGVDQSDPRSYHFVEIYADDEALATHRKSPSLEIFRPKIADWVEERGAAHTTLWPEITG